MADEERAPILGAAAAPPTPAFTDATSPPRGPAAPFDGVTPKPAPAALAMPTPTARRAVLIATLVILALAGVGAWTLLAGGRSATPVRAGVDVQSVPAGARKTGAGVLLW